MSSSSSTMSKRNLRSLLISPSPVAGDTVVGAATESSVIRKVAPRFLPPLRTSIVPPCNSSKVLEMVRPRPSPPNFRVMETSACSNA